MKIVALNKSEWNIEVNFANAHIQESAIDPFFEEIILVVPDRISDFRRIFEFMTEFRNKCEGIY